MARGVQQIVNATLWPGSLETRSVTILGAASPMPPPGVHRSRSAVPISRPAP